MTFEPSCCPPQKLSGIYRVIFLSRKAKKAFYLAPELRFIVLGERFEGISGCEVLMFRRHIKQHESEAFWRCEEDNEEERREKFWNRIHWRPEPSDIVDKYFFMMQASITLGLRIGTASRPVVLSSLSEAKDVNADEDNWVGGGPLLLSLMHR